MKTAITVTAQGYSFTARDSYVGLTMRDLGAEVTATAVKFTGHDPKVFAQVKNRLGNVGITGPSELVMKLNSAPAARGFQLSDLCLNW